MPIFSSLFVCLACSDVAYYQYENKQAQSIHRKLVIIYLVLRVNFYRHKTAHLQRYSLELAMEFRKFNHFNELLLPSDCTPSLYAIHLIVLVVAQDLLINDVVINEDHA